MTVPVNKFILQSLMFFLNDFELNKEEVKKVYDMYAKDGKMNLSHLRKFLFDSKIPLLASKQQIEEAYNSHFSKCLKLKYSQ